MDPELIRQLAAMYGLGGALAVPQPPPGYGEMQMAIQNTQRLKHQVDDSIAKNKEQAGHRSEAQLQNEMQTLQDAHARYFDMISGMMQMQKGH
jgi:hypothetical protein